MSRNTVPSDETRGTFRQALGQAYLLLVLAIGLALDKGMSSSWSQLVGVVLAIPAAVAVFWPRPHADRGQTTTLKDPLSLSMGIGLALLVVSTIFSVYRWASLLELCKGIALASCFFCAGRFVSTSRVRRRLIVGIFLGGVAAAAVGLVLFSLRNSTNALTTAVIQTLGVVNGNRLSMGFGYANTFAAFLLVPISIGVGLALNGGGKGRFLALGGTLPMIVALLASGSRGGLLVFVLMAVATPVLVGRGSGWTRAAKRRLMLAYGSIGTGMALLLLVRPLRTTIVSTLLERLGSTVTELQQGSALESSMRGRLTMIADSIRYMRAYPILGSGAGTYGSVYMRFRSTMLFASDPHSILLKALTETGIPGVLVFAATVFFVLRRFWTNATSGQVDRPLNLGAWAGCAAFLLHACLDWDFKFFGLLILLAVVCGAFAGAGIPRAGTAGATKTSTAIRAGSNRGMKVRSYTAAGRMPSLLRRSVVVCWAVVSVLMLAGGLLEATAVLRAHIDPGRSLDQLSAASIVDPLNAEHAFQRALVNAAIDSTAPSGPLSDRALTIRSDFERAIQLDRYYPYYRINYGRFLLRYQLSDAVPMYSSLVALDPIDPGTYTGLAAAYLTVYKNVDEAGRWVSKALSVDPGYSEAHWVEGMVLEKQAKYDQAAAEYRKAADLDTTGTNALVSLGMMKKSQGDDLGAIHAFWEAYDRSPDNADLRAQLEAVAPVVDVTAPASGLHVHGGQTVLIQWAMTGESDLVTKWNVYLAAPGGSWVQLTSDLPASTRQWVWQIPSSAIQGGYQLIVHGRAPSSGVSLSEDWIASGRSATITVD